MQLGISGAPAEIDFRCILALKSYIKVATILTILLKINWPNCLKLFLKIHNLLHAEITYDSQSTTQALSASKILFYTD